MTASVIELVAIDSLKPHPDNYRRGEKRCAICHLVKPTSEFHRNKAQRDGFNSYCRPCRAEREAAQRALRVIGPDDRPWPSRLREVSDAECAYLAGLLDGEGSIGAFAYTSSSHGYRGFYVRVSITNSDEKMLQWAAARWPLSFRPFRQLKPQYRSVGAVIAEGRIARPVLEDALPYLITKREQAELALRMLLTSRNYGRRGVPADVLAEREAIVAQLHHLNRKGPR